MLQRVTRGYRGLQGLKRVKEDTGCNKGQQGLPGCYKGLREITGCKRKLLEVAGDYRGF